MAMGLFFCSLLVALVSQTVLSILDTQPLVSTIPSSNIVKYINDELNLTCRLSSNYSLYRISWSLPIRESSRVSHEESKNEVMVSIHPLQEGDSGQYICAVTGEGVHVTKMIYVKVKSASSKLSCSPKAFPCSRGICIPQRFVCDGHIDCPGAKDESVEACGVDPPCKGKIQCDDGRCVAPEKCCDPPAKPTNCKSLYFLPCCRNYASLEELERLSGTVPSGPSSPASPHLSDINFIQSTIYTIVSCAVAFIFITLIMIVAICRIHMKRSAMSLHPPTSLHNSSSPSLNTRRRLLFFLWPFCRIASHANQRTPAQLQHCSHRSRTPRWHSEDDLASSESLCGSAITPPYPCTISSTGSFVVMYSSANGVRLIERLPKPPPYTETSPPSHSPNPVTAAEVWGPPPAYYSVENVSRPEETHRPVTHVSSLL